MILYLFIFPNNSLPFLNEKHFEIIHLFRANDSTTARHFFVFSAKQCGKSAALGVSWELLLLEVYDEQGMVRDGREHYHFCPRECSLSLSMQVISGTKSTKKIIIKKTLKKNRRGMNEMTEKTKKHTHLSKTFKFL